MEQSIEMTYKTTVRGEDVLKLFRLLKPYKFVILLILLLILIQSLADLFLPTLMSDIVDKGVVKGDTPYIWKMGGIMLLVSIGGSIVSILASLYASKVSSMFGKIMRHRVFRHVENYSLQEFDKIGTSSLITRTTNDINQVQQVVLMMLRMMVMAPIMCIGGLVMAIYMDKTLSLVLLVAIPVLAIAIFLIVRKGMPYFKVIQKKLDRINLVLREGLTGIRVIRSFNRTEHEHERFTEANEDVMNNAVKVNQIMALMMPLMMLIMNLCTIAIVWFGSKQIDIGAMGVGNLMAFIQYAMQIMFSLLMMTMMLVMIPRAQASAIRINEILETDPTIVDHSKKLSDSEVQNTMQGVVTFQNVSFTYPGAEKPVLKHLSFKAIPGQVTAIIGGTGSGKTTMINLMQRFFDCDEGNILVDGVDIKDWSLEKLRGGMSLVPQKSVLFSGTIEENIRYGKENASDEEVYRAATIAQAIPFIEKMEDGFKSRLSQGGTNISGGQKQRLSIARAIVRAPQIYLFDDSFSALDYKTDAALRTALQQEVREATMIIVAQRVSTVRNADQIIVLDEGQIVGVGTHDHLMSISEIYREIVASQLSEEESA